MLLKLQAGGCGDGVGGGDSDIIERDSEERTGNIPPASQADRRQEAVWAEQPSPRDMNMTGQMIDTIQPKGGGLGE